MKPADIFLFLIGHRGAIQRIAGSWWSLLIGALLVMTAGIARNYDHLDLLRNPEWVYGPFLASLMTSFIVFGFVHPYLKLKDVTPKRKPLGYLSFLSVYWMTSPCAWLYAIPAESFTDLITATKWNITFLTVVSIWRVFLITRALQVLTKASVTSCLIPVLLPASTILCIGSLFKGISLVGIMGGVRLPPHTQLLQEAAQATFTCSFFLSWLLFFIWLATFWRKRSVATTPLPWKQAKAPLGSLAMISLILILSLTAVAPTQIKIQRNHHLASLIQSSEYAEAITYASQFKEGDFSRIHYLPPNPYQVYGNTKKHYIQLLTLLDGSEPEWLRDIWLDQYVDAVLGSRSGISDTEFKLLERYPALEKKISKRAEEDQHRRVIKSLSEESSSSPQ